MGFQSTTCFFFSRATTLPSASTTSRRTKPLISGSARLLVRWREASAPRPTSYRGAMFSLWSSQRRATISTPSSKGSSIRRRNWRPYVVTDSENRRKEEARPHSKKPRFFPLPPGLCSGSPRTIFFLFVFLFLKFPDFSSGAEEVARPVHPPIASGAAVALHRSLVKPKIQTHFLLKCVLLLIKSLSATDEKHLDLLVIALIWIPNIRNSWYEHRHCGNYC